MKQINQPSKQAASHWANKMTRTQKDRKHTHTLQPFCICDCTEYYVWITMHVRFWIANPNWHVSGLLNMRKPCSFQTIAYCVNVESIDVFAMRTLCPFILKQESSPLSFDFPFLIHTSLPLLMLYLKWSYHKYSYSSTYVRLPALVSSFFFFLFALHKTG